jgi:hypothetical protein
MHNKPRLGGSLGGRLICAAKNSRGPLGDVLTKQERRGLESQRVILIAAWNVTVTQETARNQLVVEDVMSEVASHPNAEGTS